MPQSEKIKVAFLASEADPLIKVGGLGDVAGSLPKALISLPIELTLGCGLDVRLFIPFHSAIRKNVTADPVGEFFISSTTGPVLAQAYQLASEDLTVYLISGEPVTENEPVYSGDNRADGEKYTFFTLAAIMLMQHLKWKPDIFHANDWHTAAGVYTLSKLRKKSAFFSKTRTVLTVHNLPYMGGGSEPALRHYKIPASRDPGLPQWAKRQPLPLGLSSADQVVAVSPHYAEEIMTPEFGCTLENYLKSRKDSVSGILNGLDLGIWDPMSDNAIFAPFSVQSLKIRSRNKKELKRIFKLKSGNDVPLLIFISRMDHQKGIDLVLDGLKQSLNLPWQAILLGTGNPQLEQACREFQAENPERVRVEIKFDGRLARQMYAGGDMLLMPSRYEPCGLAQMIAMRYGCIPIARATGGLKDTIVDTSNPLNATGFLFEDATGAALSAAIEKAIDLFGKPQLWQIIQTRGMQTDFSWQKSATLYAQTYLSLMEKPL